MAYNYILGIDKPDDKDMVSGIVYIGSDNRFYATADTREIHPMMISHVIFVNRLGPLEDQRPSHEKTVASCEGDRCELSST